MSEDDTPDDDSDRFFNDTAREEIRQIAEESVSFDPDELDIDTPEPDLGVDPDDIVTSDDLESFREEFDALDREEAQDLMPGWSLGAVEHLLLEDCEHEEHQELRSQVFDKLGIETEGADADDEDGADADGGGGDDDEAGADGGDDEDEPEPWEHDPEYDAETSPWGKS